MHHQDGRLDLVGLEERRVVDVAERVFPERAADAALRLFVLVHPAHARAPPDASVGAGHVGDRRAGFGSLEQVRLRDHVGDLVAAPTVSLHADVFFVHKALIDQGRDTGHHGVERALARITDFVGDVRHEYEIPATGVERKADARPRRDRRAMPVQAVRHFLVEIHHHRIFLRGVETLRFVEHALERDPVERGPFDEVDRAPEVVVLLRIGLADLAHLVEIEGARPQVGEVLVAFLCEEQHVGVFGFAGGGEPPVPHHELRGRLRAVGLVAVETGGFGAEVEGRQEHRRVRVDGLLVRIELDVAEAQVVGAAPALGDVARGAGARRIERPDVVFVVDEQRRVLFGPAGAAVGVGFVGPVVQFVVDRMRDLGREVDRLAVLDVEGVPGPFVTIPPGEVTGLRREARAGLHLFHYPAAFTRLDLDEVDIEVAGGVPGELLAIGHVRVADGHIRLALAAHLDRGDGLIGQLYHASVVEVYHGAVGAFFLVVELFELHRLQERVFPVPDVEDHLFVIQFLFFLVGLRFGARGRSEEEPRAFFGEGQFAVLAEPPAVGDALGVHVGQRLRGGGACLPMVEREGGLVGVVIVPVREEGQLIARLVEGGLRVVALPRHQRVYHPRGRRDGDDAVGAAVFVRGGVDEPRSVFREKIRRGVLETGFRPGSQVAQHQRRALLFVLLFLFILLVFFLFGLFLLFGLRAILLRMWFFEMIGQQAAAVLGHLEGLYWADARDLAGAQIEDAERVFGQLVLFLFLAFGVPDGLLRGLDPKGYEARVLAELGRDATREVMRLVRGQAFDAQLGVAVFGAQREERPPPVVRDGPLGDAIPNLVGVVVERLFGGLTHRVERARQEHDHDEEPFR